MDTPKSVPAAADRNIGKPRSKFGLWLKRMRENYPFLIMVLPAVVVVFLFNYLPIYGVLIAFQDFMPGDKIFADTTIWVGFHNFKRFFTDVQFWDLMKNTFLLCIEGFLIGFPLPIIVALTLNTLNGNGNAGDERPLSFVHNNWQGNQCDLYGMFGLNDNLEHRVIVDGKVTYTVQDVRFKEATNFIANWVSKGLIDQVSFEQSQDNFLANGKGLETYGAFYWWESETVVSNPENYIVCNPLIGPNGDQTICVSNNPEVGTGEVIIFSDCANVEVLLAYFDRFYDPVVSAQINYGPIGIVYEEETDASGMLVQKPVPEGMTTDELRLQNAPLGIIYLSDYAWNNVVRMEPRAQLRLERLGLVATPFVPEGVKPCPNLQFTLEELNTLSNYETNLNDYIRTNLINWLLKGGVTDAQWDAFQNDLAGKCRIAELQKVYQDAYDRFVSGN